MGRLDSTFSEAFTFSLPSQMQARYDQVRAASLRTVSPRVTSTGDENKRQKSVRFSTQEGRVL
jgi:hypothetical protein